MWTRAASKRNTNDQDIRAKLIETLQVRFPIRKSNLIVNEFGCDSARVDVAVVNCALHGYEIKSDQDTAARLVTQVPAYCRIFDYMTLVVGSKQKPTMIEHIPDWWTVVVASFAGDQVKLKEVRQGRRNPSPSSDAVVRLLWSAEAMRLLRRRGVSVPRHFRAEDVWGVVVETLEHDELALEVRKALRARACLKAGVSQTLHDGSCTTRSNAPQLRRSQNRQWLAMQSGRHHS